jgi:hypothetical protein
MTGGEEAACTGPILTHPRGPQTLKPSLLFLLQRRPTTTLITMTKNQVHEWHEQIDSRTKRYIRGYWDSRNWRFSILSKEEQAWVPVQDPSLELWQSLRDVLFRKYQRKRVPFKFIERVDAMIAEMGGTVNEDEARDVGDDEDE